MGQEDRQRVILPWGGGVERHKGHMVVQPTKFTDLRNVFLYDGKAQARKGTETRSTLIDNTATALETVLGLSPLRSENAALGVGYSAGNMRAYLNRLTINGDNPVFIDSGLPDGELWTLPGSATFDPPVVHLADSQRRLFIAHDEPSISARQLTKFYDPFQAPAIQVLQANLDGAGLADVRFRGVVRWLSYMVGWGFNSAADPDRPDIVRVSLSGDPLLWNRRHFFLAGQASEPVMTCQPAGTNLLVYKETETHQIFGYSPATFGIRPIDQLYGVVGSRLAVSVGGTVFSWSNEGPRVSSGQGPSIDIAPPLDIGGPDPAGLAAESDPEEAFAAYFPQDRVVIFVWGLRVYALSIRNPDRPEWSYWEIGAGAEPQCASIFFSTVPSGGGGAAPTGWPIIQDGSTVLNDQDIEFEIFNNGGGGLGSSEVLEIWVKDVDGADTWTKQADISLGPARAAGGPNFEQTVTVTGLNPLNEYEVSMRYRGGGSFTTGFTDADPALWNDPACPACPDDPPAFRTGLFTTAATPEIVTRIGTDNNNGIWSRESASDEQIKISIIIPAGHTALVMEIERQRLTDGDTVAQNIDGMGPPSSADQIVEAFLVVEAALAAGTTTFTDTNSGPTPIVGEQFHDYRIRFLSPGNAPDGGFGSTVRCHAGPDPPSNYDQDCSLGVFGFEASWLNAASPPISRTCPTSGAANHNTQVWYENITQATAYILGVTASPFLTIETVVVIGGMDGDLVRSAARHKTNCSGVDDFSKWTSTDSCNIFGI